MLLQTYLQNFLEKQQKNALYRKRLVHEGAQTPFISIHRKEYLSFCSNDYLGLANHPKIKEALQQAIKIYGVGSGASHLINGHTSAHHALEQALAAYTHREKALLFSTGYMANLGVLTALLTRHDAVFLDKLCHASLIDATLLSQAKIYRYPHNDMSVLQKFLEKSPENHKLIVTEGVFSMDGDMANLPDIVALAKKYSAWLMVDDAHGLGIIGNSGRGITELYQMNTNDVPILVGTLGKAFGTFGAFVAGSALLIDTLIQSARTYIYTTASPPALAYATQVSLKIAETESARRIYLFELIDYFRKESQKRNIPLTSSITPIQPILLGSVEKALAVSTALFAQNILVTAIRPPTVPENTARLRITLSAQHEKSQIDKLLNALSEIREIKI